MNRGPAWLKNGNPVGDLSKARRCGARNRRGTPCQCPAMANGRCRLHGGLSTGPKTPEGIERIRRAVTKHGQYAKRARPIGNTIGISCGIFGSCWPASKGVLQMGKRTTPDLAAVTDAPYRARSSDNWQRLLKPLTADQRQEVLGTDSASK